MQPSCPSLLWDPAPSALRSEHTEQSARGHSYSRGVEMVWPLYESGISNYSAFDRSGESSTAHLPCLIVASCRRAVFPWSSPPTVGVFHSIGMINGTFCPWDTIILHGGSQVSSEDAFYNAENRIKIFSLLLVYTYSENVAMLRLLMCHSNCYQ